MAKPHKRGRKIPAKLIVTALLVVLQIAVVMLIVYFIPELITSVNIIATILSFVAVCVILNRKNEEVYKYMWIIFILAIPVFGLIAFALWGRGRTSPIIKKRIKQEKSTLKQYVNQDPTVMSSLEYCDMLHSRQGKFLLNESNYPVYRNTTVEYLSPGEKFFPRMLEELDNAKRYIFIEFFILAEGYMWDKIHQILKKKVQEGVEVKVMFDDFGSIGRQYKGFVQRLENDGIEVSVFNPIKPSVDLFLNNRNHRKIVVIDGVTSMTGGINIGDEYINRTQPHGYWMDCGAIFKGDATRSFVVMFCKIWNVLHPENRISPAKYLTTCSIDAEGFVQPFSDDPLDEPKPGEGIYRTIITTAQKYVHIISPYLIMDNHILKELKTTAKSGIDVKIITTSVPDKWYVHPVTQYYYDELLQHGVKVYEYQPGFIHSKLLVSDDAVATVGTINTDYRSFYLHFECGVWMCQVPAVKEIEGHFNEILADCKQIKLAEWRRRPILQKLKQTVLHLFAPFM